MFKIAIDCRCLTWSSGSGIKRYLLNVLNNLPNDDQSEFILITNQAVDCKKVGIFFPEKFKVVLLPSNDFVYKFIRTPLYLLANDIDSYWSPTPDLPVLMPKKCRSVVTLHDIFFESKPSKYNFKIRLLKFFGYYKHIAHLADHIITDSEFIKSDIIFRYKIDQKKVSVCYLAVDPNIVPVKAHDAKMTIKKCFNINGKYIFHIDCANTFPLLQAFSELTEKIEHSLVLLGGITPQVKKFIHINNLSKRIILIDQHINDYQLSCLYSSAQFFITTSIDEGFGLAPLEALKCGCEIIVPNSGCLPEIYSHSANYYEFDNVDSLKKNILLLTEQNKIVKKQIVLSRYSWKQSSIKIFHILHSNIPSFLEPAITK